MSRKTAPVQRCSGAVPLIGYFSERKLIPVFSYDEINSGIFPTAEIIRVFFQPENKYGIFLGGEINSGISHAPKLIMIFFQPKNNSGIFPPGKINTVFIFALDSGWTACGQGRWTEWTEVCPLGQKKVE